MPMKKVSASTQAGEHTYLNFHIACLKRGLLIAKPVVDYGYDMIVHNLTTNDMWRVQIKKAGKKVVRDRTYWVGATHRPRGTRYPPGLIQRFAFEKPDGNGFWILDGKRFDGKAGRGLTDKDWERWDLFDLK